MDKLSDDVFLLSDHRSHEFSLFLLYDQEKKEKVGWLTDGRAKKGIAKYSLLETEKSSSWTLFISWS
jgi:hypothetical protein